MEIKKIDLVELDNWEIASTVKFTQEALAQVGMKIIDAEKGVIECVKCRGKRDDCHPPTGIERDSFWWLCEGYCNEDHLGNDNNFERIDARSERAKRIRRVRFC